MTNLKYIILALFLASAAIVRAENANTKGSQAPMQAQTNPQVEKQRQQAEQDGQKTLDKDAITAIEETKKAIQAISDGKTDEAIAALERATGKINILIGKNPANALIPVQLEVEVIDAAPTDPKQIKKLAKAAEQAVDDKDYPAARVLLQGLISEIRVRTYDLPLATYPIAMQDGARLLSEKKNDEAKVLLQAALNTLVIVDRVTPLPLATAQEAIQQAQDLRDKDKTKAQQLLQTARSELERARELGYVGKDPEYVALRDEINAVEKQLKSNQDSGSAFARLKDKISGFFKRVSGEEKRAEVASK